MTKYFYWWVWQGWRMHYTAPYLITRKYGARFIDDKAYDMLTSANGRR